MYCSVALLSPPYGTLTYCVPEYVPEALWQVGMRVAIPLGSKSVRVGIILDFPLEPDIPENTRIKEVVWPLEDRPLIRSEDMCLVRDLAVRQGCTEGFVWGHVLPQGLRVTQIRIQRFQEQGRPSSYTLREMVALSKEEKSALGQGLLSGNTRILPWKRDAAQEERVVLQVDPPWPVRPMAHRQIAVLEYLLDNPSSSRRQLLAALGTGSAPALESLLRAGHVSIAPLDAAEIVNNELLPPPPPSFVLNTAQIAAVEECICALDSGSVASRLLFGVTGSGKTAVYFEVVKACFERGKSVLLLLPEVALALKIYRDACCALPHIPLFLYHGYQSPAVREKLFRTIGERTEPCLVVGTRSSLFLPMPSLGCIILDEEHDASFKQEDVFPYHAKEVAWSRAAARKALLLLGSATPDMKSFYAAQEGHIPLLRLPERVGTGSLPEVELVTMGKGASESPLSSYCEALIQETLQRQEQIVVLLNRRGYAPSMYCLDCNKALRCPHCEIGLTYHKGRERLLCHYCGYQAPFPSACPSCGGMHYLPLGEGTERLTERLAVMTGAGGVLRLDRDSVSRVGRMEEILQAFGRQEAQVLVGTQMLSKGHHFPNVTLAVVADGDMGLNLPDYRAAERTFQLLVQSSGRAGRGEKAGRVLIQTRDKEHYCWKYILKGDFEGFYAEEMLRRQRRRYPPFVRLALVRMLLPMAGDSGAKVLNNSDVKEFLATFGQHLRTFATSVGVTLLGPVPAPLPILRGQRRYQCLLKGERWQDIRQVFFYARSLPESKVARLLLDLDPMNML